MGTSTFGEVFLHLKSSSGYYLLKVRIPCYRIYPPKFNANSVEKSMRKITP
ncbi:MAG: hypothetical protein ACI9Z3_001980 [Roseivirga sp.]|jgi:hypothetical protein